MRIRLPGNPEFDYQVARDNSLWRDHIERALVTGAVIAWLNPDSICDPACGDGAVLAEAYRLRPFGRAVMADFSKPNIDRLRPAFPHHKRVGTILDTLGAFSGTTIYDCIVLTEILEHLADPDEVLRVARSRGRTLVISTPIDETADYDNPEHLWGWGVEDIREMLATAGWTPTSFTMLSWPVFQYTFQIWSAM
jgi:2-polyprenyl-3-methyl-5-hydroxy-6-metoxy-1,4-benzoquinol methylase